VAALDSFAYSREHFTVLVPRVTLGTKEGTRNLPVRSLRIRRSPWLPPQL
jgi:hypothetical protein